MIFKWLLHKNEKWGEKGWGWQKRVSLSLNISHITIIDVINHINTMLSERSKNTVLMYESTYTSSKASKVIDCAGRQNTCSLWGG